jgi:hypothetical protein
MVQSPNECRFMSQLPCMRGDRLQLRKTVMAWTDERIDLLKNLWEKGLTASQIAEELGEVSRNAVIGKAHRLGLKARPSPVKSSESKAAEPEKKAAPDSKPAAPEPKAAEPAPAITPDEPAPEAAAAEAKPQQKIVSIGPGGFMRQGPGDQQPPIPPAAPSGAGQAEPGDRRQDQPAGTERARLSLADGPSRRGRLPFLRTGRKPGLPLLRRTLRPGLSGTVAPRIAPSPAALAFRRPTRALSRNKPN